jgi:hypothetical protein
MKDLEISGLKQKLRHYEQANISANSSALKTVGPRAELAPLHKPLSDACSSADAQKEVERLKERVTELEALLAEKEAASQNILQDALGAVASPSLLTHVRFHTPRIPAQCSFFKAY